MDSIGTAIRLFIVQNLVSKRAVNCAQGKKPCGRLAFPPLKIVIAKIEPMRKGFGPGGAIPGECCAAEVRWVVARPWSSAQALQT